ncbi:MAG: LamG domain-containing protein [Lentisphaerae bacterium]|nr:LamG domain-containing protein [Lentisphaerota bacterium]
MRRAHILGFFAAALLTGGCDSLTQGLVAHYPMDGDGKEITAYEFNGTVEALAVRDRLGNTNAACLFDGKDTFMLAGGGDGLASIMSNCTVSAWIRPHSKTQPSHLLIVSDTSNMVPNVSSAIGIGYDPAKGESAVAYVPGVARSCEAGSPLPTGEWVRVTAVLRDLRTLDLYRNTNLVSSTTFPPLADPSLPTLWMLTVGIWDGWKSPHATYDDIRVYNRAFSIEDVIKLYHAK